MTTTLKKAHIIQFLKILVLPKNRGLEMMEYLEISLMKKSLKDLVVYLKGCMI
jgi:hypothetical protein